MRHVNVPEDMDGNHAYWIVESVQVGSAHVKVIAESTPSVGNRTQTPVMQTATAKQVTRRILAFVMVNIKVNVRNIAIVIHNSIVWMVNVNAKTR